MEHHPSKQNACPKAGTAQPGLAAGIMTPALSEGEWDVPLEVDQSPDAHIPHPHETPSSPPTAPLSTPPPHDNAPRISPTEKTILSLSTQLASLRSTITELESRLETRTQELHDARELLRLKDFIIVESARQTSEVEVELEARERKLEARVKRRDGEIERLRGEMEGGMRGVVRRRSEEVDGRGVGRRGSGGMRVEGERRGVERRRSAGESVRGVEEEMRGLERRRGSAAVEGGRDGRGEDRWRDDGWGGGVVRERGGQTWVDVRVRVGGG